MDLRAPLAGGAQQRPSPQRAVSGGSYGSSTLPKRPTLPSRLSTVRSVTDPANVVDLTGEGVKSEQRNEAAFLWNKEFVQSPDYIKIEDDEREPPAKRLKTSEDKLRSGSDDMEGIEADGAHEDVHGPPLPDVPKTKPNFKRMPPPRRPRLGIEPTSRKARGLDPPAVATRANLPPRNVLDFSPWSGKPQVHAEDTLNDTIIKAGFYDKPQGANHNESNSAKASIWPNISNKHGHGLQMLGYLYSTVVDKRQAISRCTAPQNFKPPPRVTVTDTKREAWLRDLANPDVPLRKQSRTIPHGIRGKLLLEQCLGKDIPLQRAIWLAKCVGANELRAFRRKGVSGSIAASGEAKWVREWTVSVQQFLESIIATCGQQSEWRKDTNYAVKLVTAIYAEKLLDMNHFLDWIVYSFAEATLEKLPTWIALVQIFWRGITSHSRRGRRLARSVLEHLHLITEAKGEVNAVLKTRLQRLVVVLAVSNRGCLIIPHVWERYKYLLSPKAGADETNTPARNITRRNERLAAPLSTTAANTRSPTMDLYVMLDSIGTSFDRETLMDRCLAFVPDASTLVSALLDWASTPYRAGIARIYLASNVVADLQHAGYETDATILHYISRAKEIGEQIAQNIHKVVIDLIRLEAFSVGRYLQWLITSGTLTATDGPTCATSLIAALPTTGLPLHVVNTRKTLMRRLGYDVDEQAVVNDVLARVDAALFQDAAWQFDPNILPDSLTQSAKSGVCQFVCAKAVANAKDFGISSTSFVLARGILEWMEDLPSLASLISAASISSDGVLLATVCDTVNVHAEALAALGQFKPLVDALSELYVTFRTQQPSDRAFILALTSLAQRIPEKTPLVKLLADDLAISEQQNSLAVCSPASDSLIGMHATTLDSDDDIDAVFASGNTMDDQLMQRVFLRIMQRAAKPLPPHQEPTSRVVGWLNQLRSLDGSGVLDKLVHSYLRSMFADSPESSFSASAVATLAVSESVPLSTVAELAKDVSNPPLADSVLRMFILHDISELGLNACEQYRFRLQQQQCQADQADSLVTLVRTACDMLEFEPENLNLINFIIRCISTRPGSVRKVFTEDGVHSKVLRSNASRIITRILQLGHCAGNTTAPMKEFDVKALVHMADAFSVRYCLEAMRYLKTKATWSSNDEKVLEDAVLESFKQRSDVWAQLLEFAGASTNRAIHVWAQDQLLYQAGNTNGMEDAGAHEHTRRCLELLAVTSRAANQGEDIAAVGTITEKLKEIEGKVSELSDEGAGSGAEFSGLLDQMQIILHLSVMHVHAISNESEVSKHARANLFGTLCSLLVHSKLQLHQEITENLFDLSSTLSDNLADATEGAVKLPPGFKLPQDPRLDFIADNQANTTETWLALAYQDRPAGSQQQRALSKQPQQLGGRALQSPSLQQSPQHQRLPSASGHLSFMRQDSRQPAPEIKIAPYQLRRWEIFSDPTPVMGENDGSLSLTLFGARKV